MTLCLKFLILRCLNFPILQCFSNSVVTSFLSMVFPLKTIFNNPSHDLLALTSSGDKGNVPCKFSFLYDYFLCYHCVNDCFLYLLTSLLTELLDPYGWSVKIKTSLETGRYFNWDVHTALRCLLPDREHV